MGKRKKKVVEEVPAETSVVQVENAPAPNVEEIVESRPVVPDDKSWGEKVLAESKPHNLEQRVPDFNQPISIAHNNVARVRLLKFEKFQQMQLQFTDEVPANINQMLIGKGWTFRPAEGVYTKQFGDQGPGAAYVAARRLYLDLCQQLSPGQRDEIPF